MVIKLVQTDSTDPFKITPSVGEHHFGRGKLLGCDDKRISRSHGQMEVFEDHIEIKALHQNPCFYIKCGTDDKQILKKDSIISLRNGDRFGLLPDAFWYEVIHCAVLDKLSEESPSEDKGTEEYSTETNKCTHSDETFNDDDQSKSTPLVSNDNTTSITNSTTERQEVNANCESDNSAQQSKHNEPTEEGIKNNATVKRSCSIEQNGDIKKIKTEAVDNITESTGNTIEPVAVKTEPTTVKMEPHYDQPGQSIDQPQDAKGNNVPDPVNPIQLNRPLRERCMYGATCYRRNPAHFTQFSHPRDADWGDGDQAPCPFGATCTRRDPRHHRDHQHPAGYRPPPPPGMQIVERHGHIFYINAAAVVNFYDDHFEVVDSEGDSVDHDYEF